MFLEMARENLLFGSRLTWVSTSLQVRDTPDCCSKMRVSHTTSLSIPRLYFPQIFAAPAPSAPAGVIPRYHGDLQHQRGAQPGAAHRVRLLLRALRQVHPHGGEHETRSVQFKLSENTQSLPSDGLWPLINYTKCGDFKGEPTIRQAELPLRAALAETKARISGCCRDWI